MIKPESVNAWRFSRAARLAEQVRREFGLGDARPEIGIILGTGFGETLPIAEGAVRFPLKCLEGFHLLAKSDAPEREFVMTELAGRKVILERRIHLYEDPDNQADINHMVRSQIEVMIHLGIQTLILTAAVGNLTVLRPWTMNLARASERLLGAPDDRLDGGEICLVNDFLALHAGRLPLYGLKYPTPSACLSESLRVLAKSAARAAGFRAVPGRHAMFHGQHFESLQDMRNLARDGGSVVGMSLLPECAIASLYGVPTLALGYITDSDEAPDHDRHVERALYDKERLGRFLQEIVKVI